MSPHSAFWCSFVEVKAWNNLSGSKLYFTERKARYSPNGNLFSLKPFSTVFLARTTREKACFPHTSDVTLSSNNSSNPNQTQTSYIKSSHRQNQIAVSQGAHQFPRSKFGTVLK
jgi:hypothetical protein